MARLHPAVGVFLGSTILVVILVWMLIQDSGEPGPEAQREPLVVHVAAGLRAPMEKIAADFERITGQKIELRFGGSANLLPSYELTKQGDLFLPADESYMLIAKEKHLVAEVVSLARMCGVVLLKQGETRVKTFDDLLRPEVRLAQATPDATAIGKLTRDQLDANGLWSKLDKNTTVYKGTVNDVANAVKLGSVDVGIIWDAVAFLYPDHTVLKLPQLEGVTAKIQIGVLKSTTNAPMAMRFAQYCSSRDEGLRHFREQGFSEVAEGDVASGDLVVYSGSMLRPAIEETIQDFEKREGVRVTRVYNGCGILVAQMRADARPDIYFACDQRFMDDVGDLFEQSEVVSSNLLVIATAKGNPKEIHTLADLGKPNLKVGVGHEQQCALGAITRETFLQSGTYGRVRKNVVVESPTGDFLINQLRTGSLDAVVAYRSNALPYDKDIDFTPVTGIPCAAPKQPVAIRKDSAKKQLSRRLIDSIQSSESRDRFKEKGFNWERSQ